MVYKKTFPIMGSHVDLNKHVGNLAYFDFFNTALFSFLYESGFYHIMNEARLTPIAFSEMNQYLSEVLFDDEVTITIQIVKVSETGHKFSAYGELFKKDGTKAVTHEKNLGIMDYKTRKITGLPAEALAILKSAMK